VGERFVFGEWSGPGDAPVEAASTPADLAPTESLPPPASLRLERLGRLVARARQAIPQAKPHLEHEERKRVLEAVERAEALVAGAGLEALEACLEETEAAVQFLDEARGVLPSETLPLSAGRVVGAGLGRRNGKANGRQTVIGGNPAIRALHEVLAEGRLTVVFQPIVWLETGRVAAYEVLGRGLHPRLPERPQDLFRVAESAGLASALSRAFRRKAAELARERLDLPTLFLNTHPTEFTEPGLLASLAELQALAPSLSLAVEIHERAVAGDGQLATIHTFLQEHGLLLAYDGFGAGQSRLVELTEHTPAYLKFDRRLVRGLDQALAPRRKFLMSLLSVAQDLGVGTVAIGVETAAEASACGQLGFTHGQGVHLGRPSPIARLEGSASQAAEL